MPKETSLYAKRDLLICQKRPTYLPKELTFVPLGRASAILHTLTRFICQKRPTYLPKETYLSAKRDLLIWQKGPTYIEMRVCAAETYTCQCMKDCTCSSKRKKGFPMCTIVPVCVYLRVHQRCREREGHSDALLSLPLFTPLPSSPPLPPLSPPLPPSRHPHPPSLERVGARERGREGG